jgi:hypothetical protein
MVILWTMSSRPVYVLMSRDYVRGLSALDMHVM